MQNIDFPANNKSPRANEPLQAAIQSPRSVPVKQEPSDGQLSSPSNADGTEQIQLAIVTEEDKQEPTPPIEDPSIPTADEQIELAVVTEKDRGHISASDLEQVQTAVHEAWLSQFESGTDPGFQVVQWSFSSAFATVTVPDEKSAAEIRTIVQSLGGGFVAMTKDDLIKHRESLFVLEGLVTGPAAKHRDDLLEKLVSFEIKRLQIKGWVRYLSSEPVDGESNSLKVKINVNRDAFKAMRRASKCRLRIGACGQVKFTRM